MGERGGGREGGGEGEYVDVGVLHGFFDFGDDFEVEAAGEADEAEDAEGVVVECFVGGERGADELVGHVGEAALGEVFDGLGVEVVEEGVDGAVAAEGVLDGGAEFLEVLDCLLRAVENRVGLLGLNEIPSAGFDYHHDKSRSSNSPNRYPVPESSSSPSPNACSSPDCSQSYAQL